MAAQPPYDLAVIQDILPHRTPFLFVERVIALKVADNIVAEKDLVPDDYFFAGHFPGNPIVPGVIVAEALAQTSGLLLGFTWQEIGRIFNKKNTDLFLANVSMKFFNPARPKETLRLESSFKKDYGGLFLFEVAAYVAGNPIAKGTLILARERQQ